MDEDDDQQLSSFKHLVAFTAGTQELLALDLDRKPTKQQHAQEGKVIASLCAILDEYQEQSYLLDPYLEQLAKPLIDAFRAHVRRPGASLTSPRIKGLTHLIYFFAKVRGAKTIVRLFPHEVDDLSILLQFFEDQSTLESVSWEIRYVLLLWLSLVCILPFALHHLDGTSPSASTSSAAPVSKIEIIGKRYLGVSGKERDGAVALLARYYSRQDSMIDHFVSTCVKSFDLPSVDDLIAVGYLQTLCEIVKLAPGPTILGSWAVLNQLLESMTLRRGLFAKYRLKAMGRVAVLRLDHGCAPEDVEDVVQAMLEALESEDTIVRWSASKYLARISQRIPRESSDQIVEALLGMFDSDASSFDERHIEYPWQGACLALAELARRNRIPAALVGQLLEGVLRALLFDIKRSTQSIGAGVRDAAAYVLWSLARTLPSSQILPHASQLAVQLVAVSLFDREIQIRRAASAAFQESVGRWGVFPHGIDVLRTIDFLTVSVRKRAFLEAAPSVAQFPEYRGVLVKHLVDVSLRHYDQPIRTLAAQSLEAIVRIDPTGLIPSLVSSQIAGLDSKDVTKLHGILSSLAALGSASNLLPETIRDSTKSQILRATLTIPLPILSSRTAMLLPAALQVLENSATADVLQVNKRWYSLVELATKTSLDAAHAQVGPTIRRISQLVDCSDYMITLRALLTARGPFQQSIAALALGHIDFSSLNRRHLVPTVDRLRSFCSNGNQLAPRANTIEAKRNGIEALSSLICSEHSLDHLGLQRFHVVLDCIIAGLSDYTVDQRGDVGSWVRLASLSAFQRCFLHLSSHSLATSLDQERLDSAVGLVLKQGVERLDKVREMAVEVLRGIYGMETRDECLILYGRKLLVDLLVVDDLRAKDQGRTISTLLRLLIIPAYRPILIEGAILGFARPAPSPLYLSLTNSSQSPNASNSPLIDYATSLPNSTDTLVGLCLEVVKVGERHFNTNRIFKPVLTVLGMLTDEDTGLESLSGEKECLERILGIATKSMKLVKSVPRLNATIIIVRNVMKSSACAPLAIQQFGILLVHPLPIVRHRAAVEISQTLLHGEGVEADSVSIELDEHLARALTAGVDDFSLPPSLLDRILLSLSSKYST